jgi:signal transduction histidine kinase
MNKLERIAFNRTALYAITALFIAAVFVADWAVPVTNLAIAYCAVPVIAAFSRRRWFTVSSMLVCTALTWVGFFLEQPMPQPNLRWEQAMDRLLVTGVLWLTWLLTEQRERSLQMLEQSQRELRRANDELERFSVVVAHDLRGPLSAISMMASLLDPALAGEPDPSSKNWPAAINAQIAQMDALMSTLLNYGRAGGGLLRREACDCQMILDRVRESLQGGLQACGGRVIAEHLPTIVGDPTLIAQLFQNLIENAIKYRGEAPLCVSISAIKQNESWTFSFADNGRGIDPAEAGVIFEPYRQSESKNKIPSGVGLGLATCKRIVERHGGTIWAESRTGGGAIFHFSLPIAHADAGEAAGS